MAIPEFRGTGVYNIILCYVILKGIYYRNLTLDNWRSWLSRLCQAVVLTSDVHLEVHKTGSWQERWI